MGRGLEVKNVGWDKDLTSFFIPWPKEFDQQLLKNLKLKSNTLMGVLVQAVGLQYPERWQYEKIQCVVPSLFKIEHNLNPSYQLLNIFV